MSIAFVSPTLERRRKALARLAQAGAVLAPHRQGLGHGVYPRGDRRRRPLARLKPDDVAALVAEGALAPSGIAGCYLLSGSGRARAARDAAKSEPFRAQHAPAATLADSFSAGPVVRLARISDASGMAFFKGREIAAARELWMLWGRHHAPMTASDWEAPPRGGVARGAGGAQETATLAAIDARRRLGEALSALPRSLAAALTAFCIEETGIEALERSLRWPARSGKLALKLALEMLADHFGLAQGEA